jgi:hypothetical protein
MLKPLDNNPTVQSDLLKSGLPASTPATDTSPTETSATESIVNPSPIIDSTVSNTNSDIPPNSEAIVANSETPATQPLDTTFAAPVSDNSVALKTTLALDQNELPAQPKSTKKSKQSEPTSLPIPVLSRPQKEAALKFQEIMVAKLIDQGQKRTKNSDPQRFTLIADKFMRIVQEHYADRTPYTLPKQSPVYSDSRIVNMLNSLEFIPDKRLSSATRIPVIISQLPELYVYFRERFVSDNSGRYMFEEPRVRQAAKNEREVYQAENADRQQPSTVGFWDSPVQESEPAADIQGASDGPPSASSIGETPIDKPNATPPAVTESRVLQSEKTSQPSALVTPFSSALLNKKLVELEFPALITNYLDTRTDLVTVLDLLNLTRTEMLAIPNFGIARRNEVRIYLGKYHPAVGLLFSDLSSFNINEQIADNLSRKLVDRSRFYSASLGPDPQVPQAPIDNGFRLLMHLTKKLADQVGISIAHHRSIAEQFFEVGFPRPQ